MDIDRHFTSNTFMTEEDMIAKATEDLVSKNSEESELCLKLLLSFLKKYRNKRVSQIIFKILKNLISIPTTPWTPIVNELIDLMTIIPESYFNDACDFLLLSIEKVLFIYCPLESLK